MSVRMWFLLGIIAVTACEGCVDWNAVRDFLSFAYSPVTACEGCVDWNLKSYIRFSLSCGHSLRGLCGLKFHPLFPWARIHMSQPARAVWIEILLCLSTFRQAVVTACEGCVDWNCCLNAAIACSICHSLRGLCGLKSCSLSPSQTFWLVTACEGCVDWNSILLIFFHVYPVTACEGCVDWNVYFAYWYIACYSHSLRGLCRLKCTRLPIRC